VVKLSFLEVCQTSGSSVSYQKASRYLCRNQNAAGINICLRLLMGRYCRLPGSSVSPPLLSKVVLHFNLPKHFFDAIAQQNLTIFISFNI
jgi:hypothetical protein